MWLRQVKHVQLDIPQQELKQKIRKMNGRFQTVVIRYCDELDHFLLGEMQVDQQMPAGHRANGFLKMNNVQPATYPRPSRHCGGAANKKVTWWSGTAAGGAQLMARAGLVLECLQC